MALDKILVEIFCPATSKSYDFWLPKKMTVAGAKAKICEDICTFEGNGSLFGEMDGIVLSSFMTQGPLSAEDTLEGAGVRGGDRLAVV